MRKTCAPAMAAVSLTYIGTWRPVTARCAKNSTKMKELIEQLKVHAALTGAGATPEAALEIAFGEPEAKEIQETVKQIEQ